MRLSFDPGSDLLQFRILTLYKSFGVNISISGAEILKEIFLNMNLFSLFCDDLLLEEELTFYLEGPRQDLSSKISDFFFHF